MSPLLRRGRDPQPDSPVAVLLASAGGPFPPASIAAAVERARGGPVAVLTIAQVHGSAFGLPNPGLLPSPRERQAARDSVAAAIDALARAGVAADGQVAVTRYAGRTIGRVAALRAAGHVVLVTDDAPRWRQLLEGDTVAAVRRRVGDHLTVVIS